MHLTSLQSYNIEKALIKGHKIEAVRIYREAMKCDLAQAKNAVEKILAELKINKPWYFKNQAAESVQNDSGIDEPRKQFSGISLGIGLFLLFDALVVAVIAYHFTFGDDGRNEPGRNVTEVQRERALREHSEQRATMARPGSISLPVSISEENYTAAVPEGKSFRALYEEKIGSQAYSRRKNAGDTRYDDSLLERQIKTVRSQRSASRVAPPSALITRIAREFDQPELDGVIGGDEWEGATRIVLSEEAGTTLYLQVVGDWLFVACDTPAEVTAGGFDQLRLYFHAGLLKKLVNERIHVGRSAGVTSIRQTRFRWQGEPPERDGERWKQYRINDWGLYQQAFGTSSMSSGHRQYEAVVHLGEAGLHAGIPFTFYAEVETDPLRNEQGKFVERQYLGAYGSERSPEWMVY